MNQELKAKDSELYDIRINQILAETTIEPSKVFPGTWQKRYDTPGEGSGKENFTIQGNQYIIEGISYFTIEYAKVFNEKFIELKKISTINQKILINKLVIINSNLIIGIENENTRIEYHKMVIL